MAGEKARLDDQTIALRVAREFEDGMLVNLGGGIPTLACNFVPEGRDVLFQTENGALGWGPIASLEELDLDFLNASMQPITKKPGMSLFSSDESFAMIRGGHLDAVALGALQVSEKGDIANWLRGKIPEDVTDAAEWIREGGFPPTIGGAMDLAVGTKKVIVAMAHTTPDDEPKIVKECNYELTAKECVNLIVTDIAVIEVTPEGLVLKEVAPGWTAEEVQALTEPQLIIDPDLKEMEL